MLCTIEQIKIFRELKKSFHFNNQFSFLSDFDWWDPKNFEDKGHFFCFWGYMLASTSNKSHMMQVMLEINGFDIILHVGRLAFVMS